MNYGYSNKNKHNIGAITRATAEACYALLLQGNDWLSNEPGVQITLGSSPLFSSDSDNEDGTGYFKKRLMAKMFKPQMGNISVTVSSPAPTSERDAAGWGAVYWQYFEDLDK